MPTINKIPVAWTGTPIQGGAVTTFYTDHSLAAAPNMAAVKAFFTALKGSFPIGITWTFPTTGMQLDIASGNPVGTWSTGAQTPETSTTSTTFAKHAGAVVNWKTGAFTGGREIRGKTFLVPLQNAAYDANGVIAGATQSALQAAATTLFGALTGMCVWSRTYGAIAAVTSATVPTKIAVLTSRRD